MSTTSFEALTKGVSEQLAVLRKDMPEVMNGFSSLAQAATKEGALDKKTKELVALGIAVSCRCDACIGFHVKALIKLGVTKEELEETLAMAVYMGGGPSLMYAANAMMAFTEFTQA